MSPRRLWSTCYSLEDRKWGNRDSSKVNTLLAGSIKSFYYIECVFMFVRVDTNLCASVFMCVCVCVAVDGYCLWLVVGISCYHLRTSYKISQILNILSRRFNTF